MKWEVTCVISAKNFPHEDEKKSEGPKQALHGGGNTDAQ